MTTTTERKRYRVTIGDLCGNANAVITDDIARAEQFATAWLGREWGETRTITIARFYEWNGTEYAPHSEIEW